MLLIEGSAPYIDPNLPTPIHAGGALNRCFHSYTCSSNVFVKTASLAPKGPMWGYWQLNKVYIIYIYIYIYYTPSKVNSSTRLSKLVKRVSVRAQDTAFSIGLCAGTTRYRIILVLSI